MDAPHPLGDDTVDFTISDELKSAQQLAQQILTDYTEVDKLKRIEKQEERFDAGL